MGKGLYIATIIATAAIVLLLVFYIRADESSKIFSLNEEIRQINLENELQSAYEDFDVNNKEVYCLVVNQSINTLSKRIDELERKLSTYKENAFNTTEFYYLKRNYLITNMVLFRNFLKAKDYCDLNTKTVLFFYSENKSCEPDCGIIGAQLFELSRKCDSFRAFNFPYDWPTYEFTKILEVKYGVTKLGTFVIEGEKYESVLRSEELAKKLGCSS